MGIRDKLAGIWDSLGLVLRNWIFLISVFTLYLKRFFCKNVFLIGVFFMSVFSAIILVMANDAF